MNDYVDPILIKSWNQGESGSFTFKSDCFSKLNLYLQCWILSKEVPRGILIPELANNCLSSCFRLMASGFLIRHIAYWCQLLAEK